ncbi:MAG: 1,4-alpha-glucan-branching enzyme, partial [Deltaproteobacteria bacterium]|nr:1,4-alpha-glucan-branching enzyme [Deltaproteobacteria bacterium]
MDDLEDVIRRRVACLIEIDPFLAPYEKVLAGRIGRTIVREKELTRKERTLADFASGHEYFGLHFKGNEWVFREWAPHATALCLVGDMTDWRENKSFRLDKTGTEGIWEIRLPASAMKHGDHYRLRVYWPEGSGDRIPAYSRRVVQDPHSLIFTSQVWRPPEPYLWRHSFKVPDKNPLLIYEAHVGMAQEEPKIGSYREFAEKVLPRIARLGYNTVQLMAVQEHPYYGSFGYQVSNFFAASSRFGTPEDLKFLIDSAHDRGIAIIMDIIHSHAVANEVEGLSRFDGTLYQYFHDGPRGRHSAWESRCFDYGKHQVIHFLLSNCRFWLDEYRFDGYRLDGVTSMIYLHHGLGKVFTSYDQYFDDSVDADALAYLALANKIVHQVRPDAITIAEDVSGMPGLALPLEDGGTGFDCRFAMGVPDYWIRLTKDLPE